MKVTITLEDGPDGNLGIKCAVEGKTTPQERNASDAWRAACDALQYLAESSAEVHEATATIGTQKVDLKEALTD